MYAIIDQWRAGNKSQQAVSEEAGISFHVFKYWLKKQNTERDLIGDKEETNPSAKNNGTFIPLSVKHSADFRELQIAYPNGVTITCPKSITASQVKELIKLF